MAATIVLTSAAGTNAPYKLGSPPDFGALYSGRALEFDGVADYVDTGSAFQSTFRDSFTNIEISQFKNFLLQKYVQVVKSDGKLVVIESGAGLEFIIPPDSLLNKEIYINENVSQYNGITQQLITIDGIFNDRGVPIIDKKTKQEK